MTIQLRPLLGLFQPARPDLMRSVLEFQVQEASREIARRTRLVRENLDLVTVAGTTSYALVASTGNALLDVHAVYIKGPGEDTFTQINPVVADPGAPLAAAVATDASQGYPGLFCQVGDLLYLDPTPDAVYTLKVNVSTMPLRSQDLQSVDLPERASIAIEKLAEAKILAIPGPYANPAGAAQAMRDYHTEINTLRGAAAWGQVGAPRLQVPRVIGVR